MADFPQRFFFGFSRVAIQKKSEKFCAFLTGQFLPDRNPVTEPATDWNYLGGTTGTTMKAMVLVVEPSKYIQIIQSLWDHNPNVRIQ